ncbi:LysR family transcriptional regulator [Sinomonas sp. JGH33]|uniref:LysR family transcriptional regulator n=1 Tax=Sinomonas terricola TaxID=3110330 RepID=A0ABU5T7G1_9MICC|nr:LysR family transcriptional regulator [Sinomonas sp. JGH33]MEA5455602.1 LysR family transcriptional regulator [Sinomonas sp. JGH33]
MTLRQLEYFVAVAESQSITQAALKCHVSQAGISLALKELESALGAQLIIRRKSKGVYLTPVGSIAATRARALLGEARHLIDAVDAGAEGYSGTFTVGCFSTLSTLVLPEMAEFFASRHPNVTLDFVEGSGPEIQEKMLRGQIDVCFIYEAQRHPEAETVLLRRREFLVALSPDHPLASRATIDLRELAPYPAALLNVEPASYLNEAMLRRFGVEPNVVYRSSSVHTIRAIVGRNLAYSLLMEPVDESSEHLPLRYLPIAQETGTNSVLVAHPRGVTISGLAKDLIEHCVLHLGAPGRGVSDPGGEA